LSAIADIRNASVRYDADHALHDVTVRIERGEKVALVGRSGAGKSTLLKLLFERAEVEAALVPQDFGLVKTLSVFHNVYMGHLRKHGAFYNLANLIKPLKAEVQAVLPVLTKLDMQEKVFEPAGQLSGGQQQRTAVARALHQGSDVVMADEPVSSVDEHQSRHVLDALVNSHATVVMAMHDTALALAYCDRVIGLDGGRITLDAQTAGMAPGDLNALYAS
jgi:phosphonate transport system ATP-binding protein